MILGVSGWDYSFDDLTAEAGATYFYWLEEVGTDGTSTFFGPVTATAIPDLNGLHRIFVPLIGR